VIAGAGMTIDLL